MAFNPNGIASNTTDFYNPGNLQRVIHAEVSYIFKRIIPPDNRLWMADCLRVDVQHNHARFGAEARIQFRPGPDVVPTESITIGFGIDRDWADRYVGGQADFIYVHEITDFIIKIMMVYSRVEK